MSSVPAINMKHHAHKGLEFKKGRHFRYESTTSISTESPEMTVKTAVVALLALLTATTAHVCYLRCGAVPLQTLQMDQTGECRGLTIKCESDATVRFVTNSTDYRGLPHNVPSSNFRQVIRTITMWRLQF